MNTRLQPPASSIQHPVSRLRPPVFGFWHPVSSIQHPVSSIQHPGSGIQHPFTLLELLVATLAAAVLMAALLAAMSSAWALQERAHERDLTETPRENARTRMLADLRAAVPPGGLIAAGLTAESTSSGDDYMDDVEWIAAVGSHADTNVTGDLVKVHYYLTETDTAGIYELVRTVEPNLLVVETEDPDELILLDNVVSFHATWYDGETWQDSWDSTTEDNQLPQAAWFRVDFGEKDGVTPRPLEVIVPFEALTPYVPEAAQ